MTSDTSGRGAEHGVPRPGGLLRTLRSDRIVVAGVALLLVMVALPVVAVWMSTAERDSARQLERYGTTIADRLAAAALDPLIALDRISMNAIAQEFTRLPAVRASAIYGADDELLAAADGDGDSPQALDEARSRGVFVRQVTLQEAIAGYVRVELDRSAFEPAGWRPLLITLLAASAFALLLALIAGRHLRQLLDALAREVETAPAAEGRSELGRLFDALLPLPATVTEPETPATSANLDGRGSLYLLVINIYNQVSLSAVERISVLKECEALLARVCRLYSGRTERLAGTGLLAVFDAAPHTDDHAFQALCTAMLTRRLLAALNHDRLRHDEVELTFRLALDELVLDDAPHLEAPLEAHYPDAVQRVVALSAAARDQAVAVSGAVIAGCGDPHRLEAEPLDDSVLRALDHHGHEDETALALLVTDLATGYRELLDRQARLLLAQGEH